jgi:hypothetical protein
VDDVDCGRMVFIRASCPSERFSAIDIGVPWAPVEIVSHMAPMLLWSRIQMGNHG